MRFHYRLFGLGVKHSGSLSLYAFPHYEQHCMRTLAPHQEKPDHNVNGLGLTASPIPLTQVACCKLSRVLPELLVSVVLVQ